MSNDDPIDWGVNFGADDSPNGTHGQGTSTDSEVLSELKRMIADPSRFEGVREETQATGRGRRGARADRRSGSGSRPKRRAKVRPANYWDDDAADQPVAESEESTAEEKPMTPERAERFARNIVLQQLTASMKSRQQLAKKLAEKNVPEDIANKVLDRMEEVHLVNDEVFAQMWVESRHGSRKLGKRSLQRELRDKGIDDELAHQALETVSEEDEREACHALVQKKLGVNSPSDFRGVEVDDSAPWDIRQAQLKERDKQKRRLLSMLMRKGYSGSLAMAVVSEYV